MLHPFLASRKGFSILIALGTIGVLLIIVMGIASVYQREIRLSRITYDDILTDARAEWAFEYAMLKVRNHREWFEDTMIENDIDSEIFSGSSERTNGIKTTYAIHAQTGSQIFTLWPSEHLILPLFVGDDTIISGKSKNPSFSTNIVKSNGLKLSRADIDWTDPGDILIGLFGSSSENNISWSIVAMSGSENVSLAGSGKIDGTERGTMRLRGEDCLDSTGAKIKCDGSNGVVEESLQYFYDTVGSVSDFLWWVGNFAEMTLTDTYILIFNGWTTGEVISMTSTTPYALPTLEVRAESKKWNSLKSIQFIEDKSRYYDALKYGVYDTNDSN